MLEILNDCCVLLPVSEAEVKIREYARCNQSCNFVQNHIKGNISRDRLNKMIIEKNPWGHMHFLLGNKDEKESNNINISSLLKGLKIKQVKESNWATIRGFF